jgi:hypothetical protein
MLRFLKPSLGKAVFGARILFAFALPPLAFAHEAHPSTQAAAATSDESSFLRVRPKTLGRIAEFSEHEAD